MIELSHVVKGYGPEPRKPVIDDFSLFIDRGEFVLLTGKSGVGKTTLIKLISRELSPDSGKILFEGKDIAEFSASELPDYRKKVGIVFQDFRLLSDRTVWQNLELVRHINGLSKKDFEKKASSLLRLTGMELFHKRMPDTLSGGEKQRVCIARALLNSPKVLLCDEPTGNIDPDHSKDIMKLFSLISMQGTAVVVATHDLESAKGLKYREVALGGSQIP